MMNDNLLKFLADYATERGLPRPETPDDWYELVSEGGKRVHTEDVDGRRWWMETQTVVDIGGRLIRFNDARTTGDDGPIDKGWEFEPESIEQVEEYEESVVVKKYRPVTNN